MWSYEGGYAGLAVEPVNASIFASVPNSRCDVFNVKGEKLRSFESDRSISILRSARLTPDEQSELLGSGTWTNFVTAMTSDGTALWTEITQHGIDDVWAADLDADDIDEVIVGYNGVGGLHVFDHDGVRRWKHTGIGNVWHVTAGDVTGDGNVEVLSTSATGKVHIFDSDGKLLKDLDTSVYANMIRVGRIAGEDQAARIFVVGTGDEGAKLIALDSEGNELSSTDLPQSNHFDSLALAGRVPWGAAGMRGGRVYVVDLTSGQQIAVATGQGQTPHVAWAEGEEGEQPLLLVATGNRLVAYRIKRSE